MDQTAVDEALKAGIADEETFFVQYAMQRAIGRAAGFSISEYDDPTGIGKYIQGAVRPLAERLDEALNESTEAATARMDVNGWFKNWFKED